MRRVLRNFLVLLLTISLLPFSYINAFALPPEAPPPEAAAAASADNTPVNTESSVTLPPAYGPISAEISRAAFITGIVSYFGWPAWEDYNDIWKDPAKAFTDVDKKATYGTGSGKAIDTALEEGIVGPDGSAFRPNDPITREEAAVMLAKAYKLDIPLLPPTFTDSSAFTATDAATDAATSEKYVWALASLMSDRGLTDASGNFNPQGPADAAEWADLFQNMKDTVTPPVYALPRPAQQNAPRRNVKLYTADPDAKIYFTANRGSTSAPSYAVPLKSFAGFNPAVDVDTTGTTTTSGIWQYKDTWTKGQAEGYFGFTVADVGSGGDAIYHKALIDAVAVDSNKTRRPATGVSGYSWNIYRAANVAYGHTVIHNANALAPGSPKVVEIYKDNENVRPMCWYIESANGTHGVVFDALQDTGTDTNGDTLESFVAGSLAASPSTKIDLIIGHNHVDHYGQAWSFAGHDVYASTIDLDEGIRARIPGANQDKVFALNDGDKYVLDSNVTFDVIQFPGHENGLIVLDDKKYGEVFATDIYGCTRVGSADDVDVSQVKQDLLLSIAQQNYAKLKSNGGIITDVYTGHDETPLKEVNINIFERVLQLLVDRGDSVTQATYRNARRSVNYRTVTVGDMYPTLPNAVTPDYRQYMGPTEWLSLAVGGGQQGTAPTYFSQPQPWNNVTVNYNTDNPIGGVGYVDHHAQLSNVAFTGAKLEGVTIRWDATATHFLPNMFDPWTYKYNIEVPAGPASAVTFTPTGMSTASVVKVNGSVVARGASVPLTLSAGDTVTVDVTAPDGVTTGQYVFTAVVKPLELNGVLLEKTTLNAAGTSRSWNADVTDRSKVIEQPITGYYSHYFPGTSAKGATVDQLKGRTFKLYIPERSPLRAYAYVIAVPNGVADTYNWLKTEGWIDKVDKTGEILFVLEPDQTTLTWGTHSQEFPYLAACLESNIANTNGGSRPLTRGVIGNEALIVFVENPDGSAVSFQVAGTHATNYYVGYGEGAAVLESWTSANPLMVIGQAFIGGSSVGGAILNANAARKYNGINDGSYFPGHDAPNYDPSVFLGVLDSIKTHGGLSVDSGLMTNAEIPVPTLLVGDSYAGSASLDYWRLVNDAAAAADSDGSYWQDINSNAWSTAYANSNIKKWDPSTQRGISQVKLRGSADIAGYDANAVCGFLDRYTRFTWQFAYSNNLNYRMDYYQAAMKSREVAEQELAKRDNYTTFTNLSGAPAKVELHASVPTHVTVPNKGISAGGTVYSVIFAFQDYDGNGTLDGRQAIIYQPDSAVNGAPVVFVHPGATHAPITFMDASPWWAVANDEGCVVVMVGEYAAANPVSLGHNGTENFDRSMLQLLKDGKIGLGVTLDYNRVYDSGHSAGCSTAFNLALTTETYFAAVAGTSAAPTNFATTAYMMPSYLMAGEADISQSDHDLVAEPWQTRGPNGVGKPNIFVKNTLAMNGINASFIDDNRDSFMATVSDYNQQGRYINYTWNNFQNIPLVKFTRTLAREHNNTPEEVRFAWDYMKHFSVANGAHYYSASGFKANDAVAIMKASKLTVNDIQKIDSFADATMYGEGLVQVKITYKDGVDLSGVTADTYILEDRGSLNPDFGQVKIKSASVNGQVVTLEIWDDTYATAANALVYTGPGAGVRQRNAFGIYCTGSWYRGLDGTIYYGSSDTDAYANNTTGKGYQARANLDLRLRHAGEDVSQAASLTNPDGTYNAAGLWSKTVMRNMGKENDGFQSFAELGIQVPSTSASATDGTGSQYAKGWAHIPASYDGTKPIPIVFTLQGQGICYWQLPDGANNDGCGLMYDSSAFNWIDQNVIAVNLNDRSNNGTGGPDYDYVADDAAVMKYFIDHYNIDISKIVVAGNSRGTAAANEVIRALAGRPYKPVDHDTPDVPYKQLDMSVYDFTVAYYLCQNGNYAGGGPIGCVWSAEDKAAIAGTGLKVWCVDGEQDADNIQAVADAAKYYKAAGYSDGWIKNNIRLTGLPSYLFYYWGESDHSATRMNSWYFCDEPFYGPDFSIAGGKLVYNAKLNPGDTYTLALHGNGLTMNGGDKIGYGYTVYAEGFHNWILGTAAYPEPTPIADAWKAAAPTTIGSYQRINGYFSWSVTANGVSRDIEVYIPNGARQREYWIAITLPNGVNSNEFLKDSGWFDIADKTLACLLIMKPDSTGKWGDVNAELNYVTAGMGTLASMGTYYSAMTYDYVVGYGEGAPALQLWAAGHPISMISQVYVNAKSDSAYDTLLNATGGTQFGNTLQPNNMNFDGYLDKDGNPLTQKRTFAALNYNDIPIPTWLVGNTSPSLAGYWKNANDCLAAPVTDGSYGDVYWQDKANSDAIDTSYSDIKTQVAVKGGAVSYTNPALTKNINSFLTYYSGYDNNSCYGHFITNRLNYGDAIASGNMTVVDDKTWDATNRTYIVYVPDSVKAKYSLTNPAPVVFATHGAGQTAMVFMEATDIKELAEKYGFIAVTFDLTGDAAYMAYLVNRVKNDCKTLGVAADDSRLYVYGQSAGGGAVTTYARSPLTAELFACYASTSGTWSNPGANDSKLLVPFTATYGEYDYWPSKFGYIGPGEWTGSQKTQYAWTTNTQNYWLTRDFGRSLDEELASPTYAYVDGIGSAYVPENTPISLIVHPTAAANRYRTYTWSAQGVPILAWNQDMGKGHNNTCADIEKIWLEWFDRWQKAGTPQTLLYWADGVGAGSPVTFDQTVSVTNVTLNTPSLNLTAGGTSTLTATIAPSNATDSGVTWSSSNPAVATVSSNGVVTAVGAGTATITAKTADGGKTATCTVTVTAASNNPGNTGDNGPGSGGSGVYNPGTITPAVPKPPTTTPTIPQPPVKGWKNPFTDVHQSDWFYNDVAYVNQNGLFNGLSAAIFGPNAPMTRAMFVTVLWRAEGSPAGNKANPFTDVMSGAYYYDAVVWAAANSIVNGVDAGVFAPDLLVTREQMAAILYRYEQYSGKTPPDTVNNISFADQGNISNYALADVKALASQGIINGKPRNIFDPKGSATRAEVAALMHRFLEAAK